MREFCIFQHRLVVPLNCSESIHRNFTWYIIKLWVKHISIMEEHTLKNVNNCLNTNIYSYLETSVGQSSNIYINVVHFFNTRVN